MLIRFKKNAEKIAMGLLSFMPQEKDVKKLQQTIKEYEDNPNWQLFLWKNEDVIGTIGIRFEDDKTVVIQHISVNPSHRNAGIGKEMVNKIHAMYQDQYAIRVEEHMQNFYDKCTLDYNELPK